MSDERKRRSNAGVWAARVLRHRDKHDSEHIATAEYICETWNAVAERDTLLAKLAEVDAAVDRLRKSGLVGMTTRSLAELLSACAKVHTGTCHCSAGDHARMEARIAELEAAPLRIVLDQGPPTEPGWYLADYFGDGIVFLSKFTGDREAAQDAKWSSRLDIVVPNQSEVGLNKG